MATNKSIPPGTPWLPDIRRPPTKLPPDTPHPPPPYAPSVPPSKLFSKNSVEADDADVPVRAAKKGGKMRAYAKGGAVKSQRGDGIAQRGKTKGRFV